MKIYFNQLAQQLTSASYPIYLITGAEPLLVQQAQVQIRKFLHGQEFQQITRLYADVKADMDQLQEHLSAMSLFADKIVLEIQNMQAKFDKKTVDILTHYVSQAVEDKRIVIVTDKLTTAQQKSAWFKLIDEQGLIVQIYPLARAKLPEWIRHELTLRGLKADVQVINTIADLTENNLLATQQTIEKLSLLYPKETITLAKLSVVLSDGAKYSIFDLVNAVMLAQAKQAQHILAHLFQAGIEQTFIVWGLAQAVRELIELQHRIAQGASVQQVVATQWKNKQAYIQAALTHLTTKQLQKCLQLLQQADLNIKGHASGNIQDLLSLICLELCNISPKIELLQ